MFYNIFFPLKIIYCVVFFKQKSSSKINMLPKRLSFFIVALRRIRNQLRFARDRFPMVGLLAVAVISVGIEPVLGAVSSFVLFALLLSLVTWTFFLRKRNHTALPLSLITLTLATCFSFYQGRQRERIEEQVRNWQSTLERIGPGLSNGQWQPVALRGSIEQAVRYRRASVLTNASNLAMADQTNSAEQKLDWQTLTLLDVTEMRTGAIWKPVSMRVPLTIDERVPSLLPGNRVEVYCQWRLPSEPSNPGQRDPTRYYADLGYAAQAKVERSEQIVTKTACRADHAEVRRRVDVLTLLIELAVARDKREVLVGTRGHDTDDRCDRDQDRGKRQTRALVRLVDGSHAGGSGAGLVSPFRWPG